ncbi:MAG TPA: nucleotide exchange factor GrpE [Gammaproteobacteria bacterium]|nr:nucleotide exchange factor GrpE [Gammaproteobacteria bacterium]
MSKHTHHNESSDAQEQPLELEQLTAQLKEAEQKNTQYWDRILRMQAEMENTARRAERDLVNAHKFALEKFLNELIPVIDNLERALDAARESKADAQAILEGLELTLTMLYDVLNKNGIKQINPINEAFNPSFHEAISTQPNEKCPPGTVLTVLQKGYILNERLVRPALVIVSK